MGRDRQEGTGQDRLEEDRTGGRGRVGESRIGWDRTGQMGENRIGWARTGQYRMGDDKK